MAKTKEQLKAIVAAKILGQGDQVDIGNALPEILNEIIDELDNRASKAEVDNFNEFSKESSYLKDAIVRYQGKLYQFTANKDAGDWDSAKVSQTSVYELATA